MPALTLQEAARILGVSPTTLRVQIRNGKLRAKKVGPVWTVTPKEVGRYRIENQKLVSLDHQKGPTIAYIERDESGDHDHVYRSERSRGTP